MVDFAQQKPELIEVITSVCGKQDITAAITRKQSFSKQNRQILQKLFKAQYENMPTSGVVTKNISKLTSTSTFTVSCGHQLNIFGGPLYVFFKIATVIQLCKHLKATHPQFDFVPIHWLATEDHDVAEISTVNLFGKQITWPTTQTGCTGALNTDELHAILEQIPDLPEIFVKAYTQHKTLAQATRYYLNAIFGDDGLLIIDANNATLKSLFKPVMIEEINTQSAEKLVKMANESLIQAGYDAPAHAREINLFYIAQGSRERIIKLENERFGVVKPRLQWTKSEILKEVELHPERFSPNVILRPLYSQMILPDVAFVGGPAELAYWFQLTHLFKHYKVPMPVLTPRLFGLLISGTVEKKMKNLGLKVVELFKEEHELRQSIVDKAGLLPDFELHLERPLKEGFEAVQSATRIIDPTLEASVQAEYTKVHKMIEALAKRIEKAAERRLETDISNLKSILSKLLPANGLQERHDGWLQYFINTEDFKQAVMSAYIPFSSDMSIIYTQAKPKT